MKRFLWLKSLSRSVHNDGEEDQRLRRDDEDENSKCTLLTVWKKSLLISCNGFTVIDSNGNLIYRVDNYIGNPQEIILMDASGKSLLSMRRRKRLGLLDSWFVYKGEESNNDHHYNKRTKSRSRPIFCIRKNINLVISTKKTKIIAQIYGEERCLYVIKGSYANRTCKVLEDWSNKVVAETRKKRDIVGGVSYSYGVEVFNLIVHPGFDPPFAMALVLLLDQMFS